MAVTSTPQMISWAVCMTFIRCLWLAVGGLACIWSMAAFSRDKPHDGSYSPEYCLESWVMSALSWECWISYVAMRDNVSTTVFLLVFWTVSVSWSLAVAANVVAATVADSVASRWSSTVNMDTAWLSCDRIIRSSLGSLCKVAALGCWARPMHILVVRVSSCFWGSYGLMLTIRFVVSCALLQPVVFVGLHHFDVEEAVRHVVEMFRTHGRTFLINDAMVLAGLAFSFVVAGAIPVIVSIIWVILNHWISPSIVVIIVSVCTVGAVLATLEVLLYAVKPVFVCLAEVPQSWAGSLNRRPHDEVYKVWQELQLLHPPCENARGELQA